MYRKHPLVSIGMPVFNSGHHIREALESVLAQDYHNLEVIISDNASTDQTQEICLEYAAKDERIHYHRNECNMGMSWNMNNVLKLSKGKYFKWAGSHDFIAPSFITECVEVLDANDNIVLAYPLAQAVNTLRKPIKDISPEIIDTTGLPDSARVFLVIKKIRNYAAVYYGLYRASALRRCRPIRAFMGNDQVLLTEISILGSIAVVPQVLLFRRYFGPVLDDRERITTDLIRMNPQLKGRRAVRPIWQLGKESIAGAWGLTSVRGKLRLLPLITYAFYTRWHRQLKEEVWHPYSLQQHAEPNY
jgi:glycosyltransferase involved in cell wall biosynthesis